ncbi:MAG: GDP-mannose 4,6-dehydratase [Solirubrobacterales bacterium]
MRVLITGAAGFVGRHLAEYCASQGATVVGAGRRPKMTIEPFEALDTYVSVDLLDANETEQAIRTAEADRVFHLAAQASVTDSWEEPDGAIRDGLQITLNVLEAIRRNTPDARLLFAGSGEEYGRPEKLPIDEQQPLRPQSPYAMGKAAGDLAAGFYADAHGLHVVRTRAFNHAGPGQSDTYVVASFARQIAEAEAAGQSRVDVVTGNLTTRRDFTDVRDVVKAYWLALEKCEPGAYNVASGDAIPIERILDGLTLRAHVDVGHTTDPSLVRENEVPDAAGSSARLREVTGWRPELALQQTLTDTLDWWRKQMKSEGQSA